MAFERLFDNPLYGNHSPLVLGWTDDQLEPLVDRLAPLLPDNLTDQMQLATASIARSIVAEKKLTDRAVRYARRRDAYRVPQRYRCGDPRYSWHYITRSIDTLEQIGLINQVPGLRRPRRTGRIGFSQRRYHQPWGDTTGSGGGLWFHAAEESNHNGMGAVQTRGS
jgi:hypothetical protein